jgi:phosphomannomutase
LSAIRFGTDGWRGVIGEDFTEANAALVVQAAAGVWAAEGDRRRPIVVGYDTRRNSRAVAEQSAEILAAHGWRVLLSDRPVPTPLVSLTVVERGAAGGVVVTASHNPARFNGIKLKAPFGGSVPPEFTAKVEDAIGAPTPQCRAGGGGGVERVDLVPAYLERIRARIDARRRPPRPLRIVADALHGAADGLIQALVPPGWGEVALLHDAGADPPAPRRAGRRGPPPVGRPRARDRRRR